MANDVILPDTVRELPEIDFQGRRLPFARLRHVEAVKLAERLRKALHDLDAAIEKAEEG